MNSKPLRRAFGIFPRPWAALLALGCASCNFAPRYSTPPAAIPASFKEGAATPGEAWQPARPSDDASRGAWWERYGDPALDALESEVRISNQTIQAAAANYRISSALAVQARAQLFPTAAASATIDRERSSKTFSSSSAGAVAGAASSGSSGAGSTVDRYDLAGTASYALDLWGRFRNTVSASVYSAQASAADLATAVLSTQAELANDYFALRAVDEQRRIYAETVASYGQTLDLTRTLYKSGIDSDEDLAIAQTQYDTVVAQATDLGVARAELEHAIAVLAGKPPSEFSIALAPFEIRIPNVPAGVPSELLQRRPDIAGAERRVAAANAEVGVARTAYFPSLTLNADAGFESSRFSKWFEWPSRFWSVGPELGATIFDVGGIRGANEQAHAEYDQAVAAYRQAVLVAFQAVEDNLAALRILAREAGQQKTAVASAKHNLDLALARYRDGIDSSLNVEVAQTAYLSDRQAEIQVRLREVQASVGLVMALGGGWDVSELPSRGDVVAHQPKWKPASETASPPPEPVTPANPPAPVR